MALQFFIFDPHMGVSSLIGVPGKPENGWFTVENPIKVHDLGYPYCWKDPFSFNVFFSKQNNPEFETSCNCHCILGSASRSLVTSERCSSPLSFGAQVPAIIKRIAAKVRFFSESSHIFQVLGMIRYWTVKKQQFDVWTFHPFWCFFFANTVDTSKF